MSGFAPILADAVRAHTRRHDSEIERRILAGENDFIVVDRLTSRRVRYHVPSWRQGPFRRARIEFARWRHARG